MVKSPCTALLIRLKQDCSRSENVWATDLLLRDWKAETGKEWQKGGYMEGEKKGQRK